MDRRPRTVLVPLLNLTVAPDLLSLAAGMVAGAEPFPPQRARVLVLAVVAVPAGQSPAEAQAMARGYRAMLGYLPSTITPPGRAGAPAAGSDPPPPAIPVHTLIKVAPSLGQGIRDAVTSEDADLLLLHWKGYATNADRHVFGGTLDDLLQRPPCNLLLARTGHWQEAERILLPLRGGPNAELALDVGLQLAGRLGIGLTVLHGVPRAVPTAASRRGGDAPYLALQDRLAGALQGAAGPVEQVFTLDTDVPAGVARHVLESDMVILGAAGSPNAPLVRNTLLSSVLADPARPILMARAVQPLDLAAYREGLGAGSEGAISAERWFVENTYHQDEFADTARWLAARRHRQAHISVVLPTRNDAPRIVQTLLGLRRALQGAPGAEIADEILVVDAASGDETASLAAGQGVPVRRVTAGVGSPGPGVPGPAALLREALNLAGGDILVWLDPKAGKLRPSYVLALVGPLLHDSGLLLVKPFLTPTRAGGPAPGESPDARFAPIAIADLLAWSLPELAAVPLYNWVRAFYPRLGAVMNPLGGVFAARRSLLREMLPTLEASEAAAQGDAEQTPPFSPRLAFAAGLLLETAAAHSPRAIAQVEVQSAPGGHAGRRVANPDLRQLRQIGELLALFATRPDAALHRATIQQLRTRILHASA